MHNVYQFFSKSVQPDCLLFPSIVSEHVKYGTTKDHHFAPFSEV